MPRNMHTTAGQPESGLLGVGAGNRTNGGAHPVVDRSDGRSAGEIVFAAAESRDLRSEVDRLRAERDRLQSVHREVMELLGTKNPDKIIHDLRNVLNERDLYRVLSDIDNRTD